MQHKYARELNTLIYGAKMKMPESDFAISTSLKGLLDLKRDAEVCNVLVISMRNNY